MRICDKCGKDLGDSGYHTTLGKTRVDFCSKCYNRLTSKYDELLKEVDKKLIKWCKEKEND